MPSSILQIINFVNSLEIQIQPRLEERIAIALTDHLQTEKQQGSLPLLKYQTKIEMR
jgi:GTP cyclohydrolase I